VYTVSPPTLRKPRRVGHPHFGCEEDERVGHPPRSSESPIRKRQMEEMMVEYDTEGSVIPDTSCKADRRVTLSPRSKAGSVSACPHANRYRCLPRTRILKCMAQDASRSTTGDSTASLSIFHIPVGAPLTQCCIVQHVNAASSRTVPAGSGSE
jgi:hypothetical protein